MLIKNGYIIDPLLAERNLLIFRFLMGKFFQSDSIFQFPRQKRSLMLPD